MNSDPFGYAWIKEKYSIQRREIAKHTIGRRNIRQKIILIINPSQETNMRTNMYQEFGIAHSKICLSVPQTNTCIPRDFSYNFKATFDIRACNHLLSKGLGMILQEMSARSCFAGPHDDLHHSNSHPRHQIGFVPSPPLEHRSVAPVSLYPSHRMQRTHDCNQYPDSFLHRDQ